MRQCYVGFSTPSSKRVPGSNKSESQTSSENSMTYSPSTISSLTRKINEISSSSLERKIGAMESDREDDYLRRANSRSKLMEMPEKSPRRYQSVPQEQRRFPTRYRQIQEDHITYQDDESESGSDMREISQKQQFMNRSRYSSMSSLSNKETIFGLSVWVSLLFVGLLFFTQENCLEEFKRLNCSDLGNRNSIDCQYYRNCLAEDQSPIMRFVITAIVIIMSMLTGYWRSSSQEEE